MARRRKPRLIKRAIPPEPAATAGDRDVRLAAERYPDAYEEAGPYVTLGTAVGFLGTFLL